MIHHVTTFVCLQWPVHSLCQWWEVHESWCEEINDCLGFWGSSSLFLPFRSLGLLGSKALAIVWSAVSFPRFQELTCHYGNGDGMMMLIVWYLVWVVVSFVRYRSHDCKSWNHLSQNDTYNKNVVCLDHKACLGKTSNFATWKFVARTDDNGQQMIF